MKIVDHRHGVARSDCSHPDCKAAFLRCQKASQLRRLNGEWAFADATPVRLYIATLRGAGWTLRAIAGESGVSATALSRITHNGGRRQRYVTREVAQKVMAVDPSKIPVKGSRPTSEPFVPRIGTQRRLQALLAIGWTHHDLEERGICSRNLMHQQGRWVTRSTHDKVAAVYRELCTRPGRSMKTVRWAAKLGYYGPLAWDDIDRDPTPEYVDNGGREAKRPAQHEIDEAVVERIVAGDPRPRRLTNAEAAELYRRLVARGVTTWRLEHEYGLKPERYGRRQEPAA